MPNDEFLTFDAAAHLNRCHRATIQRRVASGELEVFRLGDDRRVRYVRRSDVERLAQPTPIRRTETRVATPRTAA